MAKGNIKISIIENTPEARQRHTNQVDADYLVLGENELAALAEGKCVVIELKDCNEWDNLVGSPVLFLGKGETTDMPYPFKLRS